MAIRLSSLLAAVSTVCALVAIAGCQSPAPVVSADPASADRKEPVKQPQAAAKTEEKTTFGEPLSAGSQKVSLADLVKTPNAYAEKTVLTEGTVTAVCQSRGCWLELGDDSGTAHVKLGGHKFFVPKSASGKRAKVEATVLPAVDKGHCEQEAEEQTGKVAKVELMATGVELFLAGERLLRRDHILALSLAAAASSGCAAKTEAVRPDSAVVARQRGAPIVYQFESLDERGVSLDALKGRATVLIFITTYGDASIVQARFLKKVFKDYTPRINAAAIFMEPIENRPLARIFRDAVGLPYALAMADVDTIGGKGAFTGIDTVPSVVVLDLDGREVWRKTGVATPEEMVHAIKDAQSTVWGDRNSEQKK